jgi:hypothetical protein
MAPIRRPAPVAAPPPPVAEGPNFGDLSFYSGGFLLPEGDWALEFNVQMHQGTDKNGTPKGAARLGVMLTAYPVANGALAGEPQEQFLSMGSKAHESYVPNDTGKGLAKVPGGPGSVTNKANWWYFLESLYNTGLPVGIFTDDLSVLDGIWVHTQNIPEPEERKGFGTAATGEVQEQRFNNKMPVVSEILEGGKPWEGTGGIPTAAAAAPKATVAGRIAPRPATTRAQAPPSPAATTGDDEDVKNAAINGITSILMFEQPKGVYPNANGIKKLLLRTGTFKAVNTAVSPEMGQAVMDAFFSDDASLNGLLGEMGYHLVGNDVKPQ